MPQSYYVQWGIDIEADSPEQAAAEALRIVRKLSYPTTQLHVRDESGYEHEVQVLTDAPVIFDVIPAENPDSMADRYTIFLQPNHPDPQVRRCFLGCSVGGRAVSQWGEVKHDEWGHLGRRLSLDDLDQETRNHILARAKEVC